MRQVPCAVMRLAALGPSAYTAMRMCEWKAAAHRTSGDVAELADALDLGSSSREGVQVQLLSSPLIALEKDLGQTVARPFFVAGSYWLH